MTSRTALVTGGAGFIGSHLADRLVADGWQVAVVDDLSTGKEANLNPGARFYDADICEPALAGIVSEISPDLVFHLAAQISVAVSARAPLLDAKINVMGLLNLLEALRENGLPRLVFASTGGAIYGEPEQLPVTESVPCRPESPYAASKLAAEGYLGAYRASYGLDYSILRLGNIYGPRQEPHGEAGVVAIFAMAMLEGRQITIFGDGEDERDYVYVSDAVEALMQAAEKGRPSAYNIGTGVGANVNYLARELATLTETPLDPIYAPPRPGDIHKVWLSSKRAEEELAWRPAVGLSDGLRRTVEFFAAQVESER